MPGNSEKTCATTTYPTNELRAQWEDHADELGLSISQFIIRMVESGRKNIDMESASANSAQQLRQRLKHQQREIERQRARIEDLERQLEYSLRPTISSYVEDSPGVAMPEIVQHATNTAPARVARHLDALEGDEIRCNDDGEYYPITDSE